MKLKTFQAGTGGRTALLIHGVMSSHGTWGRVAPLLVAKGYRVIMPDLRGHGESPHADSYTPEEYAADLVESVPTGLDVAIGHSLGGLSLSLAVEDLRPGKAIYSDPAWKVDLGPEALEFAKATKVATREQIQAIAPRWIDEDIDAELVGYAQWDVHAIESLSGTRIPDKPIVPSLVVAADPSTLISPELAETLRDRGFEVRFVPNTGHVIHRDDLEAFMTALEGWI